MPFVQSYKYKLWDEYTVEELNGRCYKFTQKDKEVIVAEADINEVEGFSRDKFSRDNKPTFVKSVMYKLSGEYTVEEVYGKFYKFTKGKFPSDIVVIVPEADIKEVDGFNPRKGGRRRNRRATKRARKSRRSYSRRK